MRSDPSRARRYPQTEATKMDSHKAVAVTPEMAARIRKHYLSQGVTETDLKADEAGALVPAAARRDLSAIWQLWKGGNGYRVSCPACGLGQAFPDTDTRESIRAIRFKHCGRTEKLPLSYR